MHEKATVGAVAEELSSAVTLPATDAEQFLQLLGKNAKTAWFRCLRVAPAGGTGKDLHGFSGVTLQDRISKGQNVYLVVGEATTASGKGGGVEDRDITVVPALFVEWDDGATVEKQSRRWQALNLPEPSVMVATGGKSVHVYWVLKEPISADEWRRITERLIAHCNSDKQCSNPSRVMRLPGSVYYDKKTGKATGRCTILSASGARYSAAEIEACLPAPEKTTPPSPAPLLHAGDLPARGLDEINAAAGFIPRRDPGNGNYPSDRNALCGCSAALAEAGQPDPDGAALALLGHLWPTEAAARQVLDSTTTRNAASFWAIARDHGFDLRRNTTPPQLAQQQEKPPASLQALIQRLQDGWSEKRTARPLSPGRLAEMLPAQGFRYDELDLRAYVKTLSGWQRISDADMDSAYVLLTGKGWKIGPEAVVKAILHVARQTPVHPVRDYLRRVKADPSITPFDLDQVAPRLFRASQPLHVAMVRKWLIGAAARALKPGCQMDYCLVLKGDQGLLKSTSLKALAGGEWFTSTHANSDKDFLQNVHSCWVYELAELESITNAKQAGALKNLITTATDVFRPPYGRTPERTDRQSVFCATVNKDQFLRDDTGNRRFWVVPIEGREQLDRDAIATARDAIWKAAVLAHEAGELPMLTKDLEALSAAQNEQYNEHDAWVEMVQAWMNGDPLHRWDPDRDPSTTMFDPAGAFTSAEILYSAGLKRPDLISRADEMRLGEVLKRLGFTNRQRRVGGKAARLWSLSQPVPTVTTSTAEVVTPQNPSSAMDQVVLSRPSQPFLHVEGIENGRGGWGGCTHTHTPIGNQGRDGCDTRQTHCGAAVLPVTTSKMEVVTPSEVVTPATTGKKVRIGCGAMSLTGSAWDASPDDTDDPAWGPRPAVA